MKLLAWEGDLKLAGECDCGKKYVTPENNAREATLEDVGLWLIERGYYAATSEPKGRVISERVQPEPCDVCGEPLDHRHGPCGGTPSHD